MRNWHLQKQSQLQQVLQNTIAVQEITLTHDFISFCKFCFHTQNQFAETKIRWRVQPQSAHLKLSIKQVHLLILLAKNTFKPKNVWKTLSLKHSNSHFVFQPPGYITEDICMSKDGFPKNWSESISLLFCHQSVPLEAKACYVISNKRVMLEKKG